MIGLVVSPVRVNWKVAVVPLSEAMPGGITEAVTTSQGTRAIRPLPKVFPPRI